jgi:hypothetical protein
MKKGIKEFGMVYPFPSTGPSPLPELINYAGRLAEFAFRAAQKEHPELTSYRFVTAEPYQNETGSWIHPMGWYGRVEE